MHRRMAGGGASCAVTEAVGGGCPSRMNDHEYRISWAMTVMSAYRASIEVLGLSKAKSAATPHPL